MNSRDIDGIFQSARDVVVAGVDLCNTITNRGEDPNSRRNAYGQSTNGQMSSNTQPIHYGYGYGDKSTNPYGMNMSMYGRQNVQTGYPGFFNPAYGNGGMW